MEQPLVSVIVPVYNVEPYLGMCLRSIQGQSYRNLEVVLVNDGSTDGSLSLCRAIEQADRRFLVVDKENSGVSDSRNVAMGLCTGKYLQFVDGDDYLAPGATETLVRTAETSGADLVISRFYRVSGDHKAIRGHIRTSGVMTRQEFAEHMMDAPANFYYGVLWNKLFRRTIVEAHHLRCERDVTWCEDFLFNMEYIRYARLIASVPDPTYYYVKRGDSLVMSQGASLRRTIEMKRSTFAYYKQLYQALDLYEEQKVKVYRYLISAARDGGAIGPPDLSALADGFALAPRPESPAEKPLRQPKKAAKKPETAAKKPGKAAGKKPAKPAKTAAAGKPAKTAKPR